MHWCARTDALFDVAGMHVLEVAREPDRLVITVETDADAAGCPRCGVVAVGHGRRVHRAADAPCFGVPVVVRWLKRIWRCAEGSCPVGTFSESHELIAPRAALTARAVAWATDALAHDDTTVSALARHLGVLDAFHVVRLGTQVVDEVRRRVQHDTTGHRGHKHDPLYRIRGLLRHGAEHLSPRQQMRLETGLTLGDPHGQVELAWQCYQRLRAAYRTTLPVEGRRIAISIIDTWRSCPVPEIARLGRTLRQWRQQVLAYFATKGVSNGGTEAINLLIEKTRRLAHGFRNFANYRPRILLVADGTRPYRRG